MHNSIGRTPPAVVAALLAAVMPDARLQCRPGEDMRRDKALETVDRGATGGCVFSQLHAPHLRRPTMLPGIRTHIAEALCMHLWTGALLCPGVVAVKVAGGGGAAAELCRGGDASVTGPAGVAG